MIIKVLLYVIATLSVYPHRASLKNMPGHGGIRTYDLWNASPMLCQLSYAVRLKNCFLKMKCVQAILFQYVQQFTPKWDDICGL